MSGFHARFLSPFLPQQAATQPRELLRRSCGALIALGLTAWLTHYLLGEAAPWLIAPMGASAVLLFGVPASPLAQPWSVLVGNCISGLIGVSVVMLLGVSGWTAGLAVALAIAAMSLLRCLHPPGGAVALSAVVGGHAVQAMGWHFVTGSVLVNSVLMVLVALLFNRPSGVRYPHPQQAANPHQTQDPLPQQRLLAQDVHAVMQDSAEGLDIGEGDVRELVARVENRLQARALDGVRCADLMARDVISVTPETPLAEVWQLLARHKVRLLPVVDAARQLLGVVSRHQLFMAAGSGEAWPPVMAGQAQQVSGVMVRQPVFARASQPVAELIRLMTDAGFHHLPVLDEAGQVVGMISQSDILTAVMARLAHA